MWLWLDGLLRFAGLALDFADHGLAAPHVGAAIGRWPGSP
jgi:hypothetical protein